MSSRKISIMPSMAERKKSRTVTVWLRDDLADKVAVLKMREGGFTGWMERQLEKVKVTDEELAALKVFKKK